MDRVSNFFKRVKVYLLNKERRSTVLIFTFMGIFIIWFFVYVTIHSNLSCHQGKLISLSSNQQEVLQSIHNDHKISDEILTTNTDPLDSLINVLLELSRDNSTQAEKFKKCYWAKLDSLTKLKNNQIVDGLNRKGNLAYLLDRTNVYLASIKVKEKISQDNYKYFFTNLNSKIFHERSYFFLQDYFVLLEILMVSLLGAICNSLYYISEFSRKNKFKDLETEVYFVKLLYAPVITTIIYLGIDLLGSDYHIQASTANTIVFAFILGYFSGRAIELLNKIKDLVLPIKQNNLDATDEPVG